MKKIITSLILCLTLSLGGCNFDGIFGKRVPKGNQGQIEQEETTKSKSSGNIKGKVRLPESPLFDKSGRPLPNQTVKIDGIETSIPAGSQGELELDGDGNVTTYTLNSLLSKWKVNSAPTQLFVFGAVLVAIGIVLCYFGAWRLGIGAVCAGFSLIACGILIDKYPFVILIVIGIALVAAALYVYQWWKLQNTSGKADDRLLVLQKLTAQIDLLSTEEKAKIKAALKEDDLSAKIREVTREAMQK
jgi:hypothetical protein